MYNSNQLLIVDHPYFQERRFRLVLVRAVGTTVEPLPFLEYNPTRIEYGNIGRHFRIGYTICESKHV
jgi:hypothetical protein